VRVLFATAELSPLARVGGLAEASAGLVRALRANDIDVHVVLPDYGGIELDDESTAPLDLPAWAGPCTIRRGQHRAAGALTLVNVDGMARSHPYLDGETGEGWADNDRRFFAFSAAIAALARTERPDVLHTNDWHTAATYAFCPYDERPASVHTIHTIGYQGLSGSWWLDRLPYDAWAYEWSFGAATNPAAGALALANRVIAVSPTYAGEILTVAGGMGLQDRLAALGDRLVGIRNGIDTAIWNPSTDAAIASTYDATSFTEGKGACRTALSNELGWPDDGEPIIGMVTRFADQKGVDLVLDAVRVLDALPARLVILGAGDKRLAERAHLAAAAQPDRIAFREGYDDQFGHRIFAGADLFAMPSRFEPCGLAQMQAMAYGTIPVVTDVGGLHDTVIDDDRSRGHGMGFVSPSVDAMGFVDALHRAVRAWRQPARRRALQRRGMRADWSWHDPALAHIALYDEVRRNP
jgi:starch synthase